MSAAPEIDVLQHQFAVATRGRLVTRGVWICTAWYGWDAINRVGFLCHFDHPWSARSVPTILAAVGACVPRDHFFRSYLIGGKGYFWSPLTRRAIQREAQRQHDLNISVEHQGYDNLPWAHRSVSLCVETGEVGVPKRGGPSYPPGMRWYFDPLRKAEGSL